MRHYAKSQPPLRPFRNRAARCLGERLRLARKRRRISQALFSEDVGVSRETLRRLEKGDPSIAIGTYMGALRVLGLDRDIDAVAGDDEPGRKLQDQELARAKPRGAHAIAEG